MIIIIQSERIEKINNKEENIDGRYVIYWMQQSQRTEYNHALEFSILKANEFNLPLIVYFALIDNYPEANERHYYFMLEGLKEVRENLEKRGIKFILLHNSPEEGLIKLSKESRILVTDKGYLKIQKFWRKKVKEKINCKFYEIDTDLILPINFISDKEEYAAYTIRKKIEKELPYFLIKLDENNIKESSLKLEIKDNKILDLNNIDEIINKLSLDKSVKKSNYFIGGSKKAKEILKLFLDEKLNKYSENKNEPSLDSTSNLSPYLHFGQISSLYITLEVLKLKNNKNIESVKSFLEELIVRRELAFNFVYYNQNYDNYYKMNSAWALKTLEEHKEDSREYFYNLEELENYKTHDNAWNSAQKEMKITGKMNGYMRMYWGKKIIEWTKLPEEAFKIALYLNNKYNLDGRDPNSFTGVAWCFGKHDRAWKERTIFGKIRYMNYNGLKRKFDIKKYINKIDLLEIK